MSDKTDSVFDPLEPTIEKCSCGGSLSWLTTAVQNYGGDGPGVQVYCAACGCRGPMKETMDFAFSGWLALRKRENERRDIRRAVALAIIRNGASGWDYVVAHAVTDFIWQAGHD